MRHRGVVAALSRLRSCILIKPDGREIGLYCPLSDVLHHSRLEQGLAVEFEVRPGEPHHAHRVRVVG